MFSRLIIVGVGVLVVLAGEAGAHPVGSKPSASSLVVPRVHNNNDGAESSVELKSFEPGAAYKFRIRIRWSPDTTEAGMGSPKGGTGTWTFTVSGTKGYELGIGLRRKNGPPVSFGWDPNYLKSATLGFWSGDVPYAEVTVWKVGGPVVFRHAYQTSWRRKPSSKIFSSLSGIDRCIDQDGAFHISDSGPYCILVDLGVFRIKSARIRK